MDDGANLSREEFWWLLMQVGHLSRRVAERWLASASTSPDQLQALRVVHARARVTVGELARSMGLERNSASQLVERLVQDGLASRERSTSDRRQVFVTLSPRGESLLGGTAAEADALAADLLASVSATELRASAQVLAAIRERAADALQRTPMQPAVAARRDGAARRDSVSSGV